MLVSSDSGCDRAGVAVFGHQAACRCSAATVTTFRWSSLPSLCGRPGPVYKVQKALYEHYIFDPAGLVLLEPVV